VLVATRPTPISAGPPTAPPGQTNHVAPDGPAPRPSARPASTAGPPRRGEQVRVIGIREPPGPVPGQEREHAARRDQVPGQRRRVQELPVHPLVTLHTRHCPR